MLSEWVTEASVGWKESVVRLGTKSGWVRAWRVCEYCNGCKYDTSSDWLVESFKFIGYIRYNNPQSANALHILQNQHEYGQMNSTTTLLKPLNNPNLLLPCEKYYSWIKIDQLDVTRFIISPFTAQHVSNVSASIFRSLRLTVYLFH